MNEYILKVMRYIDNPDLFTSIEMQAYASRATDTRTAASYIASAFDATAYAARATATAAANASRIAVYAANDARIATATAAAIDRFFKITGEDKENYNDEVERLR